MKKELLAWLGGIVGAVLSGLAVWWFTTDHPEPAPPAAIAGLFAGSWVNENLSTGGLTRVEIHQRLNKIYIHVWGKCHPTDCDQGVQEAAISDIKGRSLTVERKFNFKTQSQTWTALPDGRLQVIAHSHFTDGSGRPDYDASNYFRRQ